MLNTSQTMANYGVYSFFLRQNWNNWNWNNWILELQEQLNPCKRFRDASRNTSKKYRSSFYS